MQFVPHVSNELLNYLDSLYPERCPEPEMSDSEIRRRAGQREVVRHLHGIYEDQEENRLSGKLTKGT